MCPDGRPGLLVGCSPGSPAVEIEGIGETFLAAFNGSFDGIEFAQIRRFGSSGDLLDALPLPISRDPTDLPFAGHRVDAVTENGGHFVVATRNVITDQELRTRILPTTGPVVAPIELRWSLSPVGSTSDVIGSAAIAPNLAGDDVEVAVRHIRQSVGVIFFETLFGAPDGWFLQSGQSGDTSEGGAALARGSSDVAAAWWNVFMPTIGLSTMRTLRAGWYEPAPNTTFDLVAIGNVAKSRAPALAAAGDVFLAIWTQAPTSTGLDATELRGMRFKRSLGRLDAPGGLLLATGTGALSQPVVDSDGTEFVVAWAEATEDGTAAVRSLRVSTHGTVRPSVDVVRVSAGSPIDVAATSSAAFVGVAEVESTGNVGVRVIALP